MLKSSDFIRGYIEEFKQKCVISVILIAFAKIIKIYSPVAYPFSLALSNKEIDHIDKTMNNR